jgi:Leucine Rich repeat
MQPRTPLSFIKTPTPLTRLAEIVAAVMRSHFIVIEDHLGLGITITDPGLAFHEVEPFFQLCAAHPEIKSFTARGGNLAAQFAPGNIIGSFLAGDPGMQSLDLRDNHLAEPCVSAIINGLRRNTHLLHLNIKGNDVSNQLLTMILQILQTENHTLRSLTVSGCQHPHACPINHNLLDAIKSQLRRNSQQTAGKVSGMFFHSTKEAVNIIAPDRPALSIYE